MSIINAMSVDVEDYFHVSAFEGCIDRRDWPSYACRVQAGTERILELFDAVGVRCTFFVLGWVAERYPEMVRRIAAAGHEVASHGMAHERVTAMTPEQFREDVVRSKRLLESVTGRPVIGYRAPSYSIGRDNFWALGILEEAGYRYSSSIAPVRHDLYGLPEAPRSPFRPAGGRLLEIPVTTLDLRGHRIPCGGGGWFRLFPYAFTRWALARINRREGMPAVFYFHPWEIDPDQPRITGAPWKARFRHYLNLHRTEARLARLLNDFRWGRMDEIYDLDAEYPQWNP